MMSKRLLNSLLAMMLCTSLAGCISLISEPDPITVYSLRVKPLSDSVTMPKVPWSLTVIRPNTTSILDSNRIAVRPEANVLQVYKGANWSDPLPDLLQSVIVEAFEDSGAITTGSRQNSGVPAEVALLIDIRQFEAVYEAGAKTPVVVLQLHAKVLEYPSNRVIAVRNFNARIPAATKEIPDVVQAFDQGMNTLTVEIMSWTFANGRSKAKAR
jgi:cholesterol transport system auxiliary component